MAFKTYTKRRKREEEEKTPIQKVTGQTYNIGGERVTKEAYELAKRQMGFGQQEKINVTPEMRKEASEAVGKIPKSRVEQKQMQEEERLKEFQEETGTGELKEELIGKIEQPPSMKPPMPDVTEVPKALTGKSFSPIGAPVVEESLDFIKDPYVTETSHFYIDIVFYNYILKCFVIIDLKTGKLTHQDIGQMDMYVRMFDDLKRGEGDNPTN